MKKTTIITLFLISFLLVSLTACNQNTQENEHPSSNISNTKTLPTLITAQEFKKLLPDLDIENIQFVDIRTLEEYNNGHIEQFNRNIDFYEFREDNSMINNYGLDKNKTTILICNSWNRSSFAIDIFKNEWFTNIHHITDGIISWDWELVM